MAVTADPNPDTQPLVDEILAVVDEALSEIKCIGSERMARSGLSMTHWHVLILLARHGEISMSRLADVLGVSLSNATGLIDRLEERGLVDRVRVPDDRRVVLVRVSDQGRVQLAEVDLLREEVVRGLLGRLDAEQLERLAASLHDVRDALAQALVEDPDPVLRDHLSSHAHAVARNRAPVSAALTRN